MIKDRTVQRKIEHIELCLNSEVEYVKSNGFEKYEFIHSAVTSVDFNRITFSTDFIDKKIRYPMIISSMTGGANESLNINKKLAELASEINIPIGVGSQRQLLESDRFVDSFKILRQIAKDVPIISNIGISEIIKLYKQNDLNKVNKIVEILESDALYVHLNPAQELFQVEGNRDFSCSMESLEALITKLNIPIFVKEVGNGIEYNSAKSLLEIGVKGIDVAGSGGTNWQLIEMKRSGSVHQEFLEWGVPTTYCIKSVHKLKKEFDFYLIGSGGIKNGVDIAKAFALGADFTASANIILKSIVNSGIDTTIKMIMDWFEDVKRIMFLTNSQTVYDLRNEKLKKIEELF